MVSDGPHFRPAWGLCAHLNLVAVVLNLCVTENVGIGITNCGIASSRLEESARMRIIAPSEFDGVMGGEQLGVEEKARGGRPSHSEAPGIAGEHRQARSNGAELRRETDLSIGRDI